MNPSSKANTKFVIGICIGMCVGTALTTALVLKFAPPVLNPESMILMSKFERQCNADSSVKAHIKNGVPTDCLREAVAATSGLSVTVTYVDALWKIARRDYVVDPVKDQQWKDLALLSVKRFEEVEWPAVAFANVPVLNKVYTPPGLLQCVKRLKTGSPCEFDS